MSLDLPLSNDFDDWAEYFRVLSGADRYTVRERNGERSALYYFGDLGPVEKPEEEIVPIVLEADIRGVEELDQLRE